VIGGACHWRHYFISLVKIIGLPQIPGGHFTLAIIKRRFIFGCLYRDALR
ncbi:unnamed protein product, partial [Acidithrix sp. C25]